VLLKRWIATRKEHDQLAKVFGETCHHLDSSRFAQLSVFDHLSVGVVCGTIDPYREDEQGDRRGQKHLREGAVVWECPQVREENAPI
jgi:hypothetical protein